MACVSVRKEKVIMLYAGIDWGDSGNAVAVMNEKGKVLKKWRVKQKQEDYEQMLAALSAFGGSPEECAFAIETPHHPLLHFLIGNGYTGYAPNPKSVDRAREIEHPSGKKDDFFDAETLANMVRLDRGKLRPFLPDSPATMKLRCLCDSHRSLVEARTALINQTKHCIKSYWPDALELFARLDSNIAIAFFQRWPGPEAARRAQQRSVCSFLKQQGYTRPGKIEKITAIMRRPPLPAPPAFMEAKSQQLAFLLPQLDTVRLQAASCEKQIAALFDAHPDAHIFRSLLIKKDSTSRILVARLLCDFGDRRDRYRSRSEILMLAGVVPVTYETGNGNYRVVKMRRACRKNFRNDLHHLADLYYRHHPWAAAIYWEHRNKNSTHNTALRVLGNVLLKIIYSLWKNEDHFDADIYLARRAAQILIQNARPSRK